MTSTSNSCVSALKVVRGPVVDWLKLKVPASAEVIVMGWVQQSPSADDEVPSEVAALLSRVLSQCFRLTFLDPERSPSATWQDLGDRWIGSLPAAGWAGFLRSKDLPLTSTSAPDVALDLFETASAWSQEAQIVILSMPDSLPSALSLEALAELFHNGRIGEQDTPADLCGVMLPGPDGDFAQVIFLRKDIVSPFLTLLEEQAASAGMGFEFVTRETFEQTRWFVEKVEE